MEAGRTAVAKECSPCPRVPRKREEETRVLTETGNQDERRGDLGARSIAAVPTGLAVHHTSSCRDPGQLQLRVSNSWPNVALVVG
jgi:hypothetical protein